MKYKEDEPNGDVDKMEEEPLEQTKHTITSRLTRLESWYNLM